VNGIPPVITGGVLCFYGIPFPPFWLQKGGAQKEPRSKSRRSSTAQALRAGTPTAWPALIVDTHRTLYLKRWCVRGRVDVTYSG
jgi:hypothetical protein